MGRTTDGPRFRSYVLFGIVALGALLRVLHLHEMDLHNPIFEYPAVDEKEYLDVAASLLDADAHVEAEPYYHPPGYAWFVALTQGVFGAGTASPRWATAS